jgi:hypothetical protein
VERFEECRSELGSRSRRASNDRVISPTVLGRTRPVQVEIHMDERSRLRTLLEACHRVTEQLKRLNPDEDNPFAKRIRETCRALEARLRKLEAGRRPDAAGQRDTSRETE